jgi:hypothetical protein
MINTENHGLIEPRVKDWCRIVFTDEVVEGEIVQVFEGKCCILEQKISGSHSRMYTVDWNSDYCTLLHRPFEVGDEVQYLDEGGLWFDGRTLSQHSINTGLLDRMTFRHKNPAYRDHSEWRGYED